MDLENLKLDELQFKLTKAKYRDGCNLFLAPSKESSQFWKDLHKIKHLFKWGALFKLRNGLNYHFWQDCWLLNVPLKIAYDNLYKLIRDPDSVAANRWVEDDWYIDFKRALSLLREFYRLWLELKGELSRITLDENGPDMVSQGLKRKGLFSTKSLQRF